MVRPLHPLNLLLGIGVLLSTPLISACSHESECGDGSKSISEVSAGYLLTVSSDTESDSVCTYVRPGDESAAVEFARGLAKAAGSQSAMKSLTAQEISSERLGDYHTMQVFSGNRKIATMAVLQLGDRYWISPKQSTIL